MATCNSPRCQRLFRYDRPSEGRDGYCSRLSICTRQSPDVVVNPFRKPRGKLSSPENSYRGSRTEGKKLKEFTTDEH
jgi:hypothetical protein